MLEAAQACTEYLDARYGERDPLPRGSVVLAGRPGPAYARKNFVRERFGQAEFERIVGEWS